MVLKLNVLKRVNNSAACSAWFWKTVLTIKVICGIGVKVLPYISFIHVYCGRCREYLDIEKNKLTYRTVLFLNIYISLFAMFLYYGEEKFLK